MKSHVVALLLACLAVTASGQTFFIDWKQPNPVVGSVTSPTLKREGLVKNSNTTKKELYFRYNLDNVHPDHRAQLCMSLCWSLLPGTDYPFDREPQILTADTSLPIYVDLTTRGVEGESTINVTLFDGANQSDKLTFDVQFSVLVASVRDLAEVGIRVGPNPTSDVLFISGDALSTTRSVGLYDLQGNVVRSFGTPTQTSAQFTLEGLAAGTYRLIMTMADGSMHGTSVVVSR